MPSAGICANQFSFGEEKRYVRDTTVTASQRTVLPRWAVLERRLIDAIDTAAPIFLEKYTRPGGSLVWREDYPGDGVWADDLYEAFFNWPHYHALGGSDYTGTKSFEQWNAVTRQIEQDYGRAHREFISDDDWFHNAENYIYFYHLGMADPTSREMMRRAQRFAGFYMNAEPDLPNYDAQHKIVRSPFSGSRGPQASSRFSNVSYNIEYGHATLGPTYDKPEGKWWEDESMRKEVHRRFDEVVMQGDVTVNLGIVPLVATTFLYTGDSSYREWIEEYMGAWIDRTKKNGGIVPDNLGPHGIVGEMRGGEWWGGLYGWTGRYGHNMMACAITVAAEAAYLVTGDTGYLALPRMHLDTLIENGREENGRLLVPHKHTTEEGWCEFGPITSHLPIHLWTVSQADEDFDRMEVLRKGCEEEWASVTQRPVRSADDRAWTRYIAGEVRDYPEHILQANYREVCDRLEKVLSDEQDLTTLNVHWWQQVNPVVTEALAQLTTGGPQTIYWGGLAQGRVRYYDPERCRAGLPADIAALVSNLTPDGIELTLVNVSPVSRREVVIGAGSFGEHRFTQVVVDADTAIDVDGGDFQVNLPPGTQVDLTIGMSRFCSRPSFRFPWHHDGIPFR